MAETMVDAKAARAGAAPTLSPSVRRHLGKSLRSFYAPALSEPVSERIESLLSRLGAAKG